MGFPNPFKRKPSEDSSESPIGQNVVEPVKSPAVVEAASSGSDSDDFKAIDPHSGVKRGLKTRHISMMALAGIIGPGLLIGSGGALHNGGPASLIIGFGVIGIIAFSIMQSLGELTTLYPTGGAFTDLSDRFVDKAFGVAVGWNYFIIWFCVLANEYNVISSIMVFWSDKVPIWGYFLIFWVSVTYRGRRPTRPLLTTCHSLPSLPSRCSVLKALARPSSGWPWSRSSASSPTFSSASCMCQLTPNLR
jgi:amino acid permease